MGKNLRQLFIWPQSPKVASISKDFFEMLLLSFHVKLDDEHHLTTSTMGKMESSYWCMPMERYLTTNRNATHIYHGLVHKAIWTIAYHTKRYIIPLGTSCSFVCWSQSWSTLYLFFIRWCLEDNHERSPKPFLQDTCNKLNSNKTILHINPWIYQWPTWKLLEPNTWTPILPMDKIYKNISMQTLVHKDCH